MPRFVLLALICALNACAPAQDDEFEPRSLESVYENVTVSLERDRVIAAPQDRELRGTFFFFVANGVMPEDYAPMAAAAAVDGWQIEVFPADYKLRTLSDSFSPERCTVIGGLASAGDKVFEYGFDRRHDGVDGGIVVATRLTGEHEYKGEFAAATIVASEDGIVPPKDVADQSDLYPSQSYFLTINGGNHAGFHPGLQFDGDGEADISADEQLDILGKIVQGRMARFCQTRERRILEEAREAAREQAIP